MKQKNNPQAEVVVIKIDAYQITRLSPGRWEVRDGEKVINHFKSFFQVIQFLRSVDIKN